MAITRYHAGHKERGRQVTGERPSLGADVAPVCADDGCLTCNPAYEQRRDEDRAAWVERLGGLYRSGRFDGDQERHAYAIPTPHAYAIPSFADCPRCGFSRPANRPCSVCARPGD